MDISKKLFTSESVTEGHPDKMCDKISDAILDAILEKDENARVACETVASTGLILVTGEITTSAYVDIQKIARETVLEIGYDGRDGRFDGNACGIISSITEQSPDIAMGVDNSIENDNELGAGDQGMMFGFACDETKELMPLPISMSHKMAQRLTEVRKNGTLPYLGPDGKTQVTIEYDNNKPVRVDTVVLSTQHSENVDLDTLREDVMKEVILYTVEEKYIDENTKFFINPTGRFVIGGPQGDAGLTGRKIIVDTYGGYACHGGGAFSGKDATKVDRSGAYLARYIAKNIVAAGIASQCEVQLAYAIGVAKPVSIMVETCGTSIVDENKLPQAVMDIFSLTPSGIIDTFDLKKPIYKELSAYGHMGREDLGVAWEKTDKVDALKSYFSL